MSPSPVYSAIAFFSGAANKVTYRRIDRSGIRATCEVHVTYPLGEGYLILLSPGAVLDKEVSLCSWKKEEDEEILDFALDFSRWSRILDPPSSPRRANNEAHALQIPRALTVFIRHWIRRALTVCSTYLHRGNGRARCAAHADRERVSTHTCEGNTVKEARAINFSVCRMRSDVLSALWNSYIRISELPRGTHLTAGGNNALFERHENIRVFARAIIFLPVTNQSLRKSSAERVAVLERKMDHSRILFFRWIIALS